jgi:hypothetical protein
MTPETMKQRVARNTQELAKTLRAMPKCECGHSRIKHGVYCDNSCTIEYCDCYGYQVDDDAPDQDGTGFDGNYY